MIQTFGRLRTFLENRRRIVPGEFKEVCKELTNHQAMIYSSRILELICLMGKPGCSLVDIEMYIKDKYLEGKNRI